MSGLLVKKFDGALTGGGQNDFEATLTQRVVDDVLNQYLVFHDENDRQHFQRTAPRMPFAPRCDSAQSNTRNPKRFPCAILICVADEIFS